MARPASLSAAALLGLPVRLQGIKLGRPVDVLVDPEGWRVLGFVVEPRGGALRFLPYAASQPSRAEIAVGSALMLLDDVGFYRKRSVSLRALLGAAVERDGAPVGTLVDLVVQADGEVSDLDLDGSGTVARVPAGGSSVAPSEATAA